MKKRILSLVLTFCMIASMFSMLSFSVSAATMTTAEINQKWAGTVKLADNATMTYHSALSQSTTLPSEVTALTSLAKSAVITTVYENQTIYTDGTTACNRIIDNSSSNDVTGSAISETGDNKGTKRFEEQKDKYIQIVDTLKTSAEVSKILIGNSSYAAGHYKVYVGNSKNNLFESANQVAEFKPSNMKNENGSTAFSSDMRTQIITLTKPVTANYIGIRIYDTHYLPLDGKNDNDAYSGTYPTEILKSDMNAGTNAGHGHDYLRISEFNAYGTCNADVVATSYSGNENAENVGVKNSTVVIGHADIVRWSKSKTDDKFYAVGHDSLTDIQQQCWINGVSSRTTDKSNNAGLTEYPGAVGDWSKIKNTPDDPYDGWDGNYTTVVYKLSDLDGTLANISDIFINLGEDGYHSTSKFGVYVAKGGLTTVFDDSNMIYYQDEFKQTNETAKNFGKNLHIALSGKTSENVTYVGVKVYRTITSLGAAGNGVALRWGEFNVYGTRTQSDYQVIGQQAGNESVSLPANFTEKNEKSLVEGKGLTYKTNVNGTEGVSSSSNVSKLKEDGNFGTELNMAFREAGDAINDTDWCATNFPDDESKFYQEIYMPLDGVANVSKVVTVHNKQGDNTVYNISTQTDNRASMWTPEHLKIMFYNTVEDAKAGQNVIKTYDIKENDYGYLKLVLNTPIKAGCVVIRYIVPFQRSKYEAYPTTSAPTYTAGTYYQRVHFVGVYGAYEDGVDKTSVTATAEGAEVEQPTVTFKPNTLVDTVGKYASGDYTLSAVKAPENYDFAGWFDGEDLVSTSLTLTLKDVTAPKAYKAVYELYVPKFTVTFKDPTGKVISTQIVKENQTLSAKQLNTLKAEVLKNASNIYGYEINIDTDGNYVFNDSLSSVIIADRTITLTYVRKNTENTVTFKDVNGNVLGTQKMLFDKAIDFTSYNATKWNVNGKAVVDVTKTAIYVTGDMEVQIANSGTALTSAAIIASVENGDDSVIFAHTSANTEKTVAETGIVIVLKNTATILEIQCKDWREFAVDKNTAKYAKLAKFDAKVDNFMATYKSAKKQTEYCAKVYVLYTDGTSDVSEIFTIN